MKVIVKEVGKPPRVAEVENTLDAMQKAVGGYIEALSVGNGVVMLCDEEGKLKGKPYNFDLGNDKIVGDVVFTQNGGDGDFTDLDEAGEKAIMYFFERTPFQS